MAAVQLDCSGSTSLMKLQSSCQLGPQSYEGSAGARRSATGLTHVFFGRPHFLSG